MIGRGRLTELLRRDATLVFWVNSRRYGFCVLPRVARDAYKHTMVFDARWLCFGMNLALVDENTVDRGIGRPNTPAPPAGSAPVA